MNTLTLRWTHGDHTHERSLAQGETAVIGRAAECAIRLPADDRTIHRRHAEIAWDGGFPIVRVLGQNGVRLGSAPSKLKRNMIARIARTDRLTVGGTQIDASVEAKHEGVRKIRCHNCGEIHDYDPRQMCSRCGYALVGGVTVIHDE